MPTNVEKIQICLKPDVRQMLNKQAAAADLKVSQYIERLVLREEYAKGIVVAHDN